jgi:hypothetical protein
MVYIAPPAVLLEGLKEQKENVKAQAEGEGVGVGVGVGEGGENTQNQISSLQYQYSAAEAGWEEKGEILCSNVVEVSQHKERVTLSTLGRTFVWHCIPSEFNLIDTNGDKDEMWLLRLNPESKPATGEVR